MIRLYTCSFHTCFYTTDNWFGVLPFFFFPQHKISDRKRGSATMIKKGNAHNLDIMSFMPKLTKKVFRPLGVNIIYHCDVLETKGL